MPWHVVWISQRKKKKPLGLKSPSPCDRCHSSLLVITIPDRLAASFMEVISCRLFSFSTSAWAKSACSQCPSNKHNFRSQWRQTRSAQNMRWEQNYKQHRATTMKERFPSWPAPTASSLMQSANLVLLPSPGLKKGRPVRLRFDW